MTEVKTQSEICHSKLNHLRFSCFSKKNRPFKGPAFSYYFFSYLTMLRSEIPEPGDIKPDHKLTIPEIIFIEHIIALRHYTIVVTEEYLEGVGTGGGFKAKADIRVWVIGGMLGQGLVVPGNNGCSVG